ncbi:MAG: sulfur oxidation c-type cytochrome SoxA [Gammaproteobacteria bacterium]|nr:sulfur oxidation c-type cytochrome SoxA [Gammaproteobacteria bacterium]
MQRSHIVILFLVCISVALSSQASPKEHQQQLQSYFLKKSPALSLQSYAEEYHPLSNTVTASGLPPYSQYAQQGKKRLSDTFSNGHGYRYCFRSNGLGIASDFPYFDVLSGQVKTLATEINACREENGEPAYAYDQAEMKSLQLYMMESSRRNITNVIMPNDPAAEEAFNKGQHFFFSRRGQLDMACAHCHIDFSNQRYGEQLIPPALGLPLRMPRYDKASDTVTTLHEHFNKCLSYTRAKPFPLQSEALRNLEFYLFYVNNTLPLNAPSIK